MVSENRRHRFTADVAICCADVGNYMSVGMCIDVIV